MKRVVIVGASGMVGGYALRYVLDHPAVAAACTIGRKTTGLRHPKLKEVVHQDFADCSALAGTLADQDAVVFCLGTYTGAVPDAELRRNEEEELARAFRNNALSSARRASAPWNQGAVDRPLNDTHPDATPEHHHRSNSLRFDRPECVRHQHRDKSRRAH